MVYSKALEQTIFFAEDEDTKAALIEAGADSFSIYSRAELETLCKANRAAPFSADELCKVHELRKTFNAKITGHESRPTDEQSNFDLPIDG